MKLLKKLSCIIMLFVFGIVMAGCQTTETNKVVEKLTILTINDFHGALEETNGEYGIARLANNFAEVTKNSEATVIISAGDMFQGTAISNYDHGKTFIDIMNEMKFDAMALGNHEFDWGLEVMQAYQDGDKSNGEANFPFLGCNIIEKSTGQLPKGVKEYQIIERGGLKIGIIGYIGYGIEADIAVKMVENYQFTYPTTAVANVAKKLRAEENVDVVIAVGHEGTGSNESIAALTGDSKVDAIINGHTHTRYSGTIKDKDGIDVPYIQTGSAGKYYGVIELSINKDTKKVEGGTAVTKSNKTGAKSKNIEKIVDNLVEKTAPVFKRVIGVATREVTRYDGASWAATALKDYANADIAFINIGGIRAQAFPIKQGEEITVSKIYEIAPFDNALKTVKLKGSDVKTLINLFTTSLNVTKDAINDEIYIDGVKLEMDKEYLVATIDYLFDNKDYPFYKGTDQVTTGILFKDILVDRVEKDQTIK